MSNCIAIMTSLRLLNKYHIYGPASKLKNSSIDNESLVAVDLDKVE